MQTISVYVDSIELGERHRALCPDAVTRLASSMGEIGLRQPITIRIVDLMVLDGKEVEGVPVLVAGRHRLEAARELGWEKIDCIEIGDDAVAAELWEIAENLHRLDLTKEQRDEHIRRYAELLEVRAATKAIVGQNVHQLEQAKVGRPKSVATEIAENTGLSARTVRRALAPHAAPTTPPKEVEDARQARRSRAMSAWNALDDEDRAWFRDWIDTPIMDVRYG